MGGGGRGIGRAKGGSPCVPAEERLEGRFWRDRGGTGSEESGRERQLMRMIGRDC